MRSQAPDSELWRVRVDLFADDENGSRVTRAAAMLRSLLEEAGQDKPDLGADQGTGVAKRPVVGLLFWVRADDVGSAATLALKLATQAGATCGVGPELYDLVLIPRDAVSLPSHAHFPPMPD